MNIFYFIRKTLSFNQLGEHFSIDPFVKIIGTRLRKSYLHDFKSPSLQEYQLVEFSIMDKSVHAFGAYRHKFSYTGGWSNWDKKNSKPNQQKELNLEL